MGHSRPRISLTPAALADAVERCCCPAARPWRGLRAPGGRRHARTPAAVSLSLRGAKTAIEGSRHWHVRSWQRAHGRLAMATFALGMVVQWQPRQAVSRAASPGHLRRETAAAYVSALNDSPQAAARSRLSSVSGVNVVTLWQLVLDRVNRAGLRPGKTRPGELCGASTRSQAVAFFVAEPATGCGVRSSFPTAASLREHASPRQTRRLRGSPGGTTLRQLLSERLGDSCCCPCDQRERRRGLGRCRSAV